MHITPTPFLSLPVQRGLHNHLLPPHHYRFMNTATTTETYLTQRKTCSPVSIYVYRMEAYSLQRSRIKFFIPISNVVRRRVAQFYNEYLLLAFNLSSESPFRKD